MICKIIQAKYCPNLTELMVIALILENERFTINLQKFSDVGRLQMDRLISVNFFQDLEKIIKGGIKGE